MNDKHTPTTPTLLRIDASARHQGSVSRQLADQIQARWHARWPQGRCISRDLAKEPVAQIENLTIEAFYTPTAQLSPAQRAATARSDELIAELKAAHTLLIATPIYNFAAPAALKAWIDQIVRMGQTFSYENGQFQGLVLRPRAVLALSYGAAGYQGPLAQMDFLRPYLSALLGFLGITEIQVISAEATTADAAIAAAQRRAAEAEITTLFAD
ncbi:FMN-dependent NADH-azoreductase [Paucibacter oligotrophus]|uniref:FMN dependent NADH:quinone oxidoreductase n=1 Tax=Roseateles oligotrophus TaxID=1769250 RepID=A0A840LB00_9BURK|nr:NAD(P)H-dependent oxidoreductase [Roseateles oligotrophus]MBB4843822.1 FMN-dependent NADH-azoreductase [Roseateles oligotrophus]